MSALAVEALFLFEVLLGERRLVKRQPIQYDRHIMTLMYIQFGIYLLGMLGIGWYSMSKTSDNEGYIVGGRSLGPVTTAISAGASDMSGWLLLGLPGAVFLDGLSAGLWLSGGLILGAYLNWKAVAARLRSLSETLGVITLPTYIGARFEDKSGVLKLVAAIVTLLFFTLYVASGLKGGTLLFSHAFEASEQSAMIITTFVVVSYTFLGGYLAVCWTDLVQGILMFLALLFCALLGYFAISGPEIDISSINSQAFEWRATSVLSGASLIAWGLGYFGQPHIMARFFGIKSVDDVPAARRVGMAWMIIALIFSTCIGLIGIGYNEAFGLPGVTGVGGSSERVFLALTTVLFHPVFSGFVLAAVMAAVMSTADSQLLVLSSALTEDLPFCKNMTEKKKSWVSRFGVVGFAVLAYVIAANDSGNILSMVAYAWGGFGAAFGPLIILSVLWGETTRAGAFAGIVVGTASIVVFKNFIIVEDLNELLPGFIFSFLSIILVSKFTQRPSDELLKKLKFEV